MPVRVHGLEACHGDTAFAFLVLRLATPIDRAGLIDLIHQVALLVSDPEHLIAELPEDCDAAMRLVGIPWAPPRSGEMLDAQRRLIEGAGEHGIDQAWFFQTGTRLPAIDAVDSDEDDHAEDDEVERDDREPDDGENGDGGRGVVAGELGARTPAEPHASTDDGWGDGDLGSDAAMTLPMQRSKIEEAAAEDDPDDGVSIASVDDGGDDDDRDHDVGDDDDGDGDFAPWSHGPPPQTTQVRFPVDNYPAILEGLDWEDFGIAFKLAGPWTPGESTVLVGFHSMWLAPYGGRYRNAAVTIDQRRHAAHLWVDRFAVPCSVHEQVHHLLWVVSKLDEVTPVLHACFRGATMAQKYGGLVGDGGETFVLGGNPLIAAHRNGGEAAVDAWIAAQTEWSSEEVAQMLRDLAVDLVKRCDPNAAYRGSQDAEARSEAEATGEREVRRKTEARGEGGVQAEGEATGEREVRRKTEARGKGGMQAEAEATGEREVRAEAEATGEREVRGDELRARSRDLTTYAGALLAARARAGRLDRRAAAKLRPVLDVDHKYESRRIAVVSVLAALRDRDSVPGLIRILDVTRIASVLDAVGKEELLVATAAALGAIGDPAAIPALLKLVAAPGRYNDEARPVAAGALASCIGAASVRPDVGDALFEVMARSLDQADDDEYLAEMHLAYATLARTLPPVRRDAARKRLLDLELELDPAGVAMLARRAALVICSSDARPDDDTAAALRTRVHAALSEPGYDHDSAIRKFRIVLRIAARLPELVDASDLVWLTRLAEPDIRALAHELLETAGHPMPPAAAFDRRAARRLPDGELVRWIGEPHVVGRPALVVEAGRRKLAIARPMIIRAAHAVIDRARPSGEDLLEPDARLLETAVAALLGGPLDDATIALFDRMLRHANQHVKWELLQAPPRDKRLIGGMIHVLGEAWGWQEITAKTWLASFTEASSSEPARDETPPAHGDAEHDGDDDGEEDDQLGGDDDDEDDEHEDGDDDDASDDDGRIN